MATRLSVGDGVGPALVEAAGELACCVDPPVGEAAAGEPAAGVDAPAVGGLEIAEQAVDVRAVVPDVQLRHSRVPAHLPAVGLDARGHRGSRPGRLDPVLPRGDHQAGREPLHIPLERAGQGLVEVAQVEGQVALGRGPQAEVQHVGVAT